MKSTRYKNSVDVDGGQWTPMVVIDHNNVHLGVQLSVATVVANDDFIVFEVKTTARAVHSLDTSRSADCAVSSNTTVLHPVVGTRSSTTRVQLARDGTPSTLQLLDGTVIQVSIAQPSTAGSRASRTNM